MKELYRDDADVFLEVIKEIIKEPCFFAESLLGG